MFHFDIKKQMSEKAICSNIVPSLCSENLLFYNAEYMGESSLNQVWAKTFEWSTLATCTVTSKALF